MLYHKKNPHGGDHYANPVRLDFSANVNPYGTPKGVIEAVQEHLSEIWRYPDPYCRRLVGKIAEFEEVPPEWILCGNGAAELIYTFCDAARPRRAVELAPTFSEYALGLQRVGCVPDRYFLRQENDFAPDGGLISFLEEKKPEAVFLCQPNNPTGRLIEKSLMQKTLNYCKENNCMLLLDECFLDLTDEGESLKPFLKDFPQLLILKAFTKSYGMAGIRLGYCLSGNQELLEKMSSAVQPWNVSNLAQAAGIAALEEKDFLKKTRDLICTERPWLIAGLKEFGFWVCPSSANFVLFRGPADLYQKLKEQEIAVRSCDNYAGLGTGWYRIAVRQHRENEALVAAVRQCMEDEK